jgi:putative molybdopterin biosynthesis protein
VRSEGHVRNQLRAIRTRLALSQQDLATAAGITRQTVGGLEAGLYAPSAGVALRLARTLGCRVEDLFWLEEDLPALRATPSRGFPADRPVRVSLAQVGGAGSRIRFRVRRRSARRWSPATAWRLAALARM